MEPEHFVIASFLALLGLYALGIVLIFSVVISEIVLLIIN